MMRAISHLARGVCLFAGLASSAWADPIDILFVGNSFTHGHVPAVQAYNSGAVTDPNGTNYGGVAGIFKKFTTEEGLDYNVTIEAVSSMTLDWHYDNKASIIGDPKWDTVVLQELSTGPLPASHGGDPSGYYLGATELKNLVLANNPAASLYLYETWASPASVANQNYTGAGGLQGMQNDLQAATYNAYYNIGFTGVARVGDAFMRAVDQGLADPANDGTGGKINLWAADDDRHASAYGSYLSAAVLYGKDTGADPRSLSVGAGSAAAGLGLNATSADALNRIAYEINTLAEPAPPPVPAKLPVTAAGFSGSVSAAGTPRTITGNSLLVSLTTAEGTFTTLTGATANSVVTSNTLSSLGTAPANANAAVSGLTANDGVNNLQSGNFQFNLGLNGITTDTRFFILESAPQTGAVGDAATITLIDALNNPVGTFTLTLSVADFTNSAANSNGSALALLTYTTGQGTLVAKLGAVTFSPSDFSGTGDLSQVTGIRITSTTIDPNVVGTYAVPEPGTYVLALLGLGMILLVRRPARPICD